MKCKDSLEMLNSYFDNNIDPMKDKLLAEHIESCPECKSELELLNRYRAIMKTVKPAATPDNFLSELHRKIEMEKAENPLKKFITVFTNSISRFSFPLEAAGVLAAAVIVFFLYQPFFSGKVHEQNSEYSMDTIQENSSPVIKTENGKTSTAEYKLERSGSKREVMSDKDNSSAIIEIVKEKKPEYESADDNLSTKTDQDLNSVKTDLMKNAKSAESRKRIMRDEEQSYSSENMKSQGAVSERKDSASVSVNQAELLFKEFSAAIIKKDLSDNKKLYYRIKISPERYNILLERLNGYFTVEEKSIIKNNNSYEIEFFLKKNEN